MSHVLLSLLLLAVAAPALAQPAPVATEGTASSEKRGPTIAPRSVRVWTLPSAVFRAPVKNVSPAERAARAAQRIEALPADVRPDEIQSQAATLGDLQGVMVLARNQILFGILPEDLDPG